MYQNVNYGYNPSIHDFNDILSKYNEVCRLVPELREVIKYLEEKVKVLEREKKESARVEKIPKRCRFHNTGFCKKLNDCIFEHPIETCLEYLKSGNCSRTSCFNKRHPRTCRYWKAKGCFRGRTCLYLHNDVKKEAENINEEFGNVDKEVENIIDEVEIINEEKWL